MVDSIFSPRSFDVVTSWAAVVKAVAWVGGIVGHSGLSRGCIYFTKRNQSCPGREYL